MVFEALVSDLLNRFIGDYVENLDKSQLKIGIWGGNVVLENLRVKENALSEFDIPFKIKAGQIGTLTLKIPWKKLYSDAVVATLDGLYLLLVPGASVAYDGAKEERYQQEAKQRELQRIEDALRTAARRVPKGLKKHKKRQKAARKLKRDHEGKSEKPPEEKKDSFLEKVATQVIKNLQVKIGSIHLRYEDDVSDPQRPLSIGVTLSELSLQTTDENWKLCILNEAAKIIYKLGRLDCLCAYWNVNSQIFYRGSWQDIVDQLKCGIGSKDQELPQYHYIFKPIFASAKIRINPNAEQELDSPKAQLLLEVQNIDVQITKPQYVTMVEMLEAIDRMVKNGPYRKFRPDAPVHADARVWWRYAISSILEVHVRRSSRMWSWSNIRRHRRDLRTYKTAYKSKLLSQSKLSPAAECNLQDLEKVLDVFSITLARQQAHVEVVRSGQKLAAKKASAGQKQGGGGFFRGFFGRRSKTEEEPRESEEAEAEGSALDGIMTPAEKEKLYAAIGYSGSSHNLTLPKEYVAVVVTFQLFRTSVTVRDQPHVPEILRVQMIHLSTQISQRPGAQALRAEASLRQWSVTGLEQHGAVPALISASAGDPASASLLRVAFELTPDDSRANYVVRVHSQPVQLIYDAMTVNGLAEFFKTGEGVDLEVLTSATLSKLEEIKEKTAAGLSHVIETRKVLDLRIDLRPSYLLLPKSGFYSDASEVVVVDFGNLRFNSVDEKGPPPSSSSSSFSSLEEIMDRAYERYCVELRQVQVLYSKSGDEWKSARAQNSSRLHILRPLHLTLHLSKCMVDKDARMPRLKVSGELPLLHVKMSDEKIQKVLELIHSIPLPQAGSAPSTPGDEVPTLAGSPPRALGLRPALLGVAEPDSDASRTSPEDENGRRAPEELTDLQFAFEVQEALLELTRRASREKTVLALRVRQLGAQGKVRTFDVSVTSYLRSVTLDYCRVDDGGPLHLIRCSEQQSADLLKVDFVKADLGGPNFRTLFDNTQQTLKVEFSSLDVLVDAEALLSTVDFLSGAVPPQLLSDRDASADVRKRLDADRGRTGEPAVQIASKSAKDADVFSFKFLAALGCFHVELCDGPSSVADIRVQGMDASVLVQAKQTEVFARLRDIVVTDVNPRCIHKKAVSIMGEEVFSFKLCLFPGATEGDDYGDTAKVDGKVTLRLGCIKMVYLHKFLTSLLMFAGNFQTAKKAVSAATAQAASGVRHLAHKSFRLSTDIKLKAPLIVVPQSSTSYNAVLVDLGLITVSNSFSLVAAEGFSLPAVVDKMDIRLTQLKLSRTTLRSDSSSSPDIEILEPINIELVVTRNMASSWFTKIPGTHVQGVLRSLKVSVGEEDVGVLMKVLLENIGEASQEHSNAKDGNRAEEKVELGERQSAAPSPRGGGGGGVAESVANGGPGDNAVNVLINFEIREVLLSLKKTRKADSEVDAERPFLVFQVAHLGVDTKVRTYDTCATTYIKKMTLTCLEFKDSSGDPLCLVSSSAESGAELLKVQYFKADRRGPNFSSVYKNTEQMINVTFTSLDLMLHAQALLSAVNFLSGTLSSGGGAVSPERTVRLKAEDGKMAATKSNASATPEFGNVIDLKVMVALGAFNVLVCDQSSNIADIKIQGLRGSMLVQGPQTHLSAHLKDFVVLNVDPSSIHKKAISIVGDEVFSFSVSLTPNATEGSGYADTSKTDGRVKLNVGCIQVVYLHKLVVALLNFTNNFQTAKAAVTAATAQAADRAASSVRDFAQKSFRLSTDVNLKAPLVVVPQSSTSSLALVVDLGLITVSNAFSLLPVDGCSLPAVVDNMDIRLTQLKLSRNCLDPTSGGPSRELVEPVNLNLRVNRNLAASWYNKMAAVEVDGDLKPTKMSLSQDDLKVLLKILTENLAEADGPEPSGPRPGTSPQPPAPAGPQTGGTEKQVNLDQEREEILESVKFNFSIESLGLVLYEDEAVKSPDQKSQENLCLGEFALHLLKASGKIWNNGNMELGTILTNCTLDDRRTGVDRVTSRMLSRRDSQSSEVMIDLTYRQSPNDRSVVAILQKLSVCASVDFLVAVADFFLQALPRRPPQNTGGVPSGRTAFRQTAEQRPGAETARPIRTSVRGLVVDPEVVFVAGLTKADAPSLLVSFQCDLSLEAEEDGAQTLKAQLRALEVLACPFIHDKEDRAITTVLRPCSVVVETKRGPGQPLSGSVTVEEVIVKISPFILNTVSTITAAMTARRRDGDRTEDQLEDLKDLWITKKVRTCNYWFLGVDQASEVTENFRDQEDLNVGQNFAAQVKVIQVTLESGVGHRTVPLLLAESSFSGSAQNRSSLLQLKANVTLEVNYFNEIHAVWEPLIERVDAGARRWSLQLEMKNNPAQDKSPVHGDDFVTVPEARTAVNISSGDALNVTVSRCGLDVLADLAKAFSEGSTSAFDTSAKEKAPFTVFNALGVPLSVQHSANLRPAGAPQRGRPLELPPRRALDLEHSAFEASSRGRLSALQRQESSLFHLSIVPSGYSEIADVPVDKPGRRLYNVRGPSLQESVSVLIQIDAADGNKLVTVRSPLQIRNHFSVPFSVLKFCPSSRSLQPIGLAHPEKEFHIPLDAYRLQLYVRPASGPSSEYGPSSTCVSWKEEVHRSSEVRSLLQCPPLEGGGGVLPLMVGTLAAPDALDHIAGGGEDDWDPAYVLHLRPVATLRNLLPYTLGYMMESCGDSYQLPEGSSSDLLNARVSGEVLSLVLLRYQGRDWHGHLRLDRDMPEFLAVCLTCDSDAALTLDLGVHVSTAPGQLLLSVFSPFWIINKTRRVLRYRAEDVSVKHPSDVRDIVLFSFRRKNLLSKNKLQLRVSTSSWSDGFSLDTVGSYGCVRCPGSKDADFLVGVSIRMSSFNLTKMVSLTPFYTLVNKSSFELEVGEPAGAATRWHYIPSAECLPLWPESSSGKLCVRAVGGERASEFFFFNRQDNGTLLGLDACGGIVVDVNVSEHSCVVGFGDYYEGAAPALLVNHTPWVDISYKQSGCAAVHRLRPGEARRFAWDDPAGLRRLAWTCAEHSGETDLLKDELGQFSYDGLSEVHWVSFLDGRQRVLIFTEDVAVVTKARQAEELEQFQQEIQVSLQNLGLSLVDNASRQEVAYVGVPSSGVVWEMKRKNRWKPFSQKHINLLEKSYQSLQSGESEAAWTKVDADLEVNLSAAVMTMRRPFSCPLRRNFLSGIQVEFKRSRHQRSLRARLHWLQVDNQLPGAIFPIAFHPVPPPKSVALDSEPKPFIDVSVITRFNQHSSVTQFKYFMALVQEMAVKIDQGFLSAILALLAPAGARQAEGQRSHLIQKDVALLQAELMESSLSDASGLSFFEHFHISPIKLHLSLSLGSGDEGSARDSAPAVQSLNLLLKSIGATLTDVDDLVFRLAYFEVSYRFYRREKLTRAVARHYSEQFLKQLYVLVLGLDVLGNPFGLIRGLSEGVEAFFYEPFQGAVRGPEEFAEGFVIGVRSLLGHTVGGAAGVVSRITGSVGKGLAAITMDKEYQQKRREEMNRTPRDFGGSLAKGGKGLLKGVVSGVTGIVTKPVEGAKKEGTAGFFKGVGKGLVGAVARPTGGIVDMASSAFQGIQRAAESTEDVSKLRPVRLIREDGIVRPYDLNESQGFDLFQRCELKRLEGEVFRDQCPYPGRRKTNIVVTNRRVVCVKEMDFVGHFSKDWECLFENFYCAPNVSGTRLNIYCKEHHVLKLPKKDAEQSTRSIELRDETTAQRMLLAVSDAHAAHRHRRMSTQKSQRFLKAGGRP
ncbi:intermembrane lipid transfer protein VPS13C isoform X3 [Syngnathoides biaculeatus]|uniref:intermembrane lipid transfer protein VPS13C isoform X3 n=1 Tax=Syngnathoides biaculeatus TaxID=300417 RepID=UPI002ADDE7E0|nr:intermembrane lipid transfer protein VPS13C isoform X3 [Syngnathoides biaculeatus]